MKAGYAAAKCVNGLLVVDLPADRTDFKTRFGQATSLHIYDYNLFYADFIRAVRIAAGVDELDVRGTGDKVNVCAICEKFGGGGHVLAAGARVKGSLAEVEKRILEEVRNVVSRSS